MAAVRFIVDGSVNREKLTELLAVQAELAELDYKECLDLTDTKVLVELVKDVAAMQSQPSGGYIVVGVDGHGNPSTEHGALTDKDWDESRLRAKFKRYVSVSPGFRSVVHQVVDRTGKSVVVALLFIPPHPDGFSPMLIEGNPDGGRNPVFRKGDVFARHGTASEHWNQEDVRAIHARAVEQGRQQGHREALAMIQPARMAQQVARGPLGSVTWQLDDATFTDALAEAVRAEDRVATRTAAMGLRSQALQSTVEGETRKRDTVLDRLTTVLAVGVTLDNDTVFSQALSTFHALYENKQIPDEQRVSLWWAIITRVEAVGALAVRLEEWEHVHRLANQPYHVSDTYFYTSWLRHGSVEASRARIIPENKQGWTDGAALVTFAAAHARRLKALHPDVPDTTPAKGPADTILDSTIQFDVLWNVIAVAAGREHDHYPGVAHFNYERSRPAFRLLTDDIDARSRLLPDTTEADLAEAIAIVLHRAKGQAEIHGNWMWDWSDDRKLTDFLIRHGQNAGQP